MRNLTIHDIKSSTSKYNVKQQEYLTQPFVPPTAHVDDVCK
jgi:hypothetical protein